MTLKGLLHSFVYLQVSILVGELSSKFSDIKQQIDDPFLARLHTVIYTMYMYK